MDIRFSKMHGLGNDFVMIDNMNGDIELSAEQVAYICDRHFGIGADGVILVEAADDQDGFMNYINSDGTFAQMCGNGVRCFAKYLVDNDYIAKDADELSALTRAGVREIAFERDCDGKLEVATVNMGCPILDPKVVPCALDANADTEDGIAFVKESPIASPWGDFKFTAVSMGNPHAVCFIDDMDALSDDLFSDPNYKSLDTLDVDKLGSYYESHVAFPEKANIEFAVIGDDRIFMRVYERGCGQTLACGTGACATSVAATLTKRASRKNDVELKGGVLGIDWSDNGHVLMTGPAKESFSGVITID